MSTWTNSHIQEAFPCAFSQFSIALSLEDRLIGTALDIMERSYKLEDSDNGGCYDVDLNGEHENDQSLIKKREASRCEVQTVC